MDVIRNDADVDVSVYDKVMLSPGPGLPKDAGKMMEVIQSCAGKIPLLGVCLGMQGIGAFLGSELYNQELVKHGVQETIEIRPSVLFNGLGTEIQVGLYHSWAIHPEGDFEVTGISKTGVVMAIENPEKRMYGVQFHPESVMTPEGRKIIASFLERG